MSRLAGRIEVTIGWRDGRISSVEIHNSRPAVVSRLLQGKTYTEALTLIPMLFSVCGVAQQIASTEAVESALQTEIFQTEILQTEILQRESSASVSRARQQLLLAENIRELGLRMARDWLDDRSMAQQLMQWFVRIRAELQWSLALNAQEQTEEQIQEPSNQNLKMTELVEDVRSILPGQDQLNECRQQLDAAFGDIRLNPGVSAMPALGSRAMMQLLPELERSLKSEAGFAQQPSLLRQCYETGYAIADAEDSGADEKAHQTLTERFDRFVSALLALPDQLLQPTPMILRNDQGMALVTAARGLLIHRVSLQDEIVTDYQLIAPTEWNFHPQGALLSMLEGVAVEYDRLEALVNRLIVLVDPCVDWSVGIRKDHA